MPYIKSKFSLNQQVSVIKSGKTGSVTTIVFDAKGVHADVQMPSAKRPWRYAESELQTAAEAAKAAKAKAKAAKTAKPVVVKAVKPVGPKAAKPVKAVKATPAKVAKQPKAKKTK